MSVFRPNRYPMWEAHVIQDDADAKVYAAVRVKEARGYPPPPQLEGTITYWRRPAREAAPA